MKIFGTKILCALVFFLLLNSHYSAVLAQRTALVGHWPLNGDVNDSIGRHVSAFVGTNFIWLSGSSNAISGTNALELNPQNQANTWVQVANAADLQFGSNDFTISYWVKKLVSTANYFDAYGIGRWDTGANPGSNSWVLLLNNGAYNDQPAFAIEGGTTIYSVASPANISLSVWHHLVGVKRQSSLELYVDGVFTNQLLIPTNISVNNNSNLAFFIGASASPGYGAEAVYDDVQIYQGALSNGGVAVGQVAGGQVAYLYQNPGQTTGPIDPPLGLVAWWPANNNAIDVVGGNNGVLTNGVYYGPGEVNQTFNFNSNSALVLLTNAPALQLTNFTIETWVKRASLTAVSSDPNPVAGNALMFGYGSGGYSFGMGPDGKLLLTQVDNNDIVANAGIIDTNWHHIAVTTTNTFVVFYIDGSAYPTGNYNVNFRYTTQPAIGGRADNINQYNNDSFLGALDELSVYNRALAPSEIQSIYQAGSSGKNLSYYVSITPPALNIAHAGTNITIFWSATTYILQQSATVGTSFTNSVFPVTVSNGTNFVTLSPASGNQFFRLAYP